MKKKYKIDTGAVLCINTDEHIVEIKDFFSGKENRRYYVSYNWKDFNKLAKKIYKWAEFYKRRKRFVKFYVNIKKSGIPN